MKIPIIEYQIYYPLYNDNELIKLNLSLCQDTKIDLSISVKIDGKIEKYNPRSDYYNNICFKTTSESGTDITLKDRRNEFVQNNRSLCEENCILKNYDYIKKKAKCSCDIKTDISLSDIKFNKTEFFKSFTDINNMLNINIIKCYKYVFKIKELKNNYGFFIIAFVMILYFITLFIFLFSSYGNYKKEIKNIIWALKFSEIPLKRNQIMKKPMIINKNMKINNNKNHLYYQNKNKININKYNIKIIKNSTKHNLLNNESSSFRKFGQTKKEKADKINILAKKILNRKEFEINSLNYQEALKIDHRNFCQYYNYLLKYNHPISFSFASYNDYNIKVIKKFLFFFSFSLDFTINALFFTDETIHKIYQDRGKFNFLYQIPQTLYSTLITKLIDILIKNLALPQDTIVVLKQEKIKKNLEKKHKKLLRILNIKFFLFFVLSFIILIFFWYYISCFCGVYINSQTHLIKDSLISLVVSLLIPFGINIILGMFRMLAMGVKKPSRKCLMFLFWTEETVSYPKGVQPK